MTEARLLPKTERRAALYAALRPQIKARSEDEDDLVASLANPGAGFFQALRLSGSVFIGSKTRH